MRAAPATALPTVSIAAFKQQFPLGSTSRVLLQDGSGQYAGLVPTAAVFADTGPGERVVSELAIFLNTVLSPEMSIAGIMEVFDASGADDLAVVDGERHILGMLTEKYVRKRYADEIDRSQRDAFLCAVSIPRSAQVALIGVRLPTFRSLPLRNQPINLTLTPNPGGGIMLALPRCAVAIAATRERPRP